MKNKKSISLNTLDLFSTPFPFPLPKKLVIAFSGGVDSVVLLHKLVSQRDKILSFGSELSATHINHQLSQFSNNWQDHCISICKEFDLPLITKKVEVPLVNRKSLEQLAREVRFDSITSSLEEGDFVVLAHHAEDQAETILLKILRGGGLRAASGIKTFQKIHSNIFWRPLLGFDKIDLINYANKFNLKWIEDDSNNDLSINRNFLRQKIFPTLNERWKNSHFLINNSGKYFEKELNSLDYFLNQKFESIESNKINRYTLSSINLTTLLDTPEEVAQQLLKFWLKKFNINLIQSHLIEIHSQLKVSNRNEFTLKNSATLDIIFHRNRNTLSIYSLDIKMKPCFTHYQHSRGNGVCQDWLEQNPLNCRFFQGAETMTIKGVKRRLSSWYKKQKIPILLQKRLPLLFAGDNLIGVSEMVLFDFPKALGKGILLKIQ